MENKNRNPYELIREKNLHQILAIYFQVNQLKHLLRQGWLRSIDKEKCESVADHIFGVAILVILINDYYNLNLDVQKIVFMALFHEMGEIKNGDITPFDGISKEEKHALEREGVLELFSNFPGSETYISVWDEFEERKTREAKFVFQVEKLEMAIQAKIYEGLYKKDLFEFQSYVDRILEEPCLIDLLRQL